MRRWWQFIPLLEHQRAGVNNNRSIRLHWPADYAPSRDPLTRECIRRFHSNEAAAGIKCGGGHQTNRVAITKKRLYFPARLIRNTDKAYTVAAQKKRKKRGNQSAADASQWMSWPCPVRVGRHNSPANETHASPQADTIYNEQEVGVTC